MRSLFYLLVCTCGLFLFSCTTSLTEDVEPFYPEDITQRTFDSNHDQNSCGSNGHSGSSNEDGGK